MSRHPTAQRSIAFVLTGLVLAGFSLALSACGAPKDEAEAKPRPVRIITVAESEVGETLQLAGVIESQVQVDFSFRIGGRMIERLVDVGDTVEAGQVVAKLDPSDEQNGLRAAEAALAAVKGQREEARIDFERQRHLYERKVAARVAFERAEQIYTTAQAAVDTATAQLAIAQQRLNDTQIQVDAPGVVTQIGAEPGEVVQPGRMVVQLARDDGKDAVFDVPASAIAPTPRNPEVAVWLSMSPGVKAMGRVREVAPRADTVTGTFRVRVGLIDPPEEMRLGSTVVGRANFGGGTGIEIPASALTQSGGQPAVWLVDPDTMSVQLRPIDVARFTPASVAVTDGLKVGDLIVTAGVQALRPGQEVRLAGGAS